DEDLSFFGPLGFLLVVPLTAAVLVGFFRGRQTRARAVLAASVPLYVVGLAAAYVYNGWIGRYVITALALAMPLAGALYRVRALAAAAAVVGIATLALTHAYNRGKPTGLDGSTPIWARSRPEAQ